RPFGGTVPPGWAPCDGTALAVAQYPALFQAIGTTYGGDGVSTFNLPDLRGCVLVGVGQTYGAGAAGGEAAVVLDISQIPQHGHGAVCSSGAGKQASPANGVWAMTSSSEPQYAPTQLVLMAPDALQTTGDRQGHPNMQPYLTLVYGIGLGT
ncbi:MAG TPA: tail fiber protein, partial [Phenylobacterium sp.]|nr:tail fiber protein [Phenylobacterium sp.]